MSIGVDSATRTVTEKYVGVDNSPRKIVEGYIGVDDKPRQFYSSGTKLSDLPTGTIIPINENGTPHNFRIAQHNYIQAGVTAVERVLCLADTVAFNANNVNTYGGGTLDTFLTGAYRNRLDENVRNRLVSVAIPTTPGNGNYTVTTIPRDVFVFSGTEVGFSDTNMAVEGSQIDIYTNDVSRIKYSDDAPATARTRWTRSASTYNSVRAWGVYESGGSLYSSYDSSRTNYVAPTLTFPSSFSVKDYTLPLNELSWNEIAEISRSGKATAYFRIGDEKDITLTTGETLTLQIYGFSHDDLADGSGKAGITFGLKNLMAETRAMNGTSTNVGGFTGSAMHSWMTSTLLPSLPADLRTLIQPVTKKTSAGNQSTTIQSQSMSVFLFSEIEVFGSTTWSTAGEGLKYAIFADTSSRIKHRANGAGDAGWWWERSPRAGNASYFCYVQNNGSAGSANPTAEEGVCFGFCV